MQIKRLRLCFCNKSFYRSRVIFEILIWINRQFIEKDNRIGQNMQVKLSKNLRKKCQNSLSTLGRFNGACVLIEQTLQKDLLYLACRHHIYELYLRSVFEAKLPEVARSPDGILFKNFQRNWHRIETSNLVCAMDDKYCSKASGRCTKRCSSVCI